MKILDFKIIKQDGTQYSFEVCDRALNKVLAKNTFDLPISFITDFKIKRLDRSLQNTGVRFDEILKYGETLYKKLFPGEIEQLWQEYKRQNSYVEICLRFTKDAAHLEALPWETIYDGMEFIAAGKKSGMSRLPVEIVNPQKITGTLNSLKMLALFSSPLDLPDKNRLDFESEQSILLAALNDPIAQNKLTLVLEDEAKHSLLHKSLSQGYHIFHFTGHGLSPESGGGLLIEDENGNSKSITPSQILEILQPALPNLRLTVLAACLTARNTIVGDSQSLGRFLCLSGIPNVVAMSFPISDSAGLLFAKEFYSSLTLGIPLEQAISKGRYAIF